MWLSCCSESEFSPVKNPIGSASDSPDTARKMLTAQSLSWLKSAGCTVLNEGQGGQIEVAPFVSYSGEGLEALNGLEVDCAYDLCLSVAVPEEALSLEAAQKLGEEAKSASKSTLEDGGATISTCK